VYLLERIFALRALIAAAMATMRESEGESVRKARVVVCAEK
jgi:hypothetical protein